MRRITIIIRGVFFTLCFVLLLHCELNNAWGAPGIFTNKKTYLPGESIQVTFTGAPGYRGDWVCVVPSRTPDNDAGSSYQYLPGGLERGSLFFAAPSPGNYEVRAYYYYRSNGYIVSARHSFSVANTLSARETNNRASLDRNFAKSTTQGSNISDPKLKEVQYKLLERGYDPGAADGFSGRKTKTALRDFQRDNQLKQTSSLNRETLIALDLLHVSSKKEVQDGFNAGKEELVADKPVNNFKQSEPQPSEKRSTPSATREQLVASGTGQIASATSMVAEPSVMAESLGNIPQGAVVDILGEQNNFYKIRYNGNEGYVYSTFLKIK
jgi:peptidoglycan hydrolase-like protein with peptidoglycan-binding domain